MTDEEKKFFDIAVLYCTVRMGNKMGPTCTGGAMELSQWSSEGHDLWHALYNAFRAMKPELFTAEGIRARWDAYIANQRVKRAEEDAARSR